MLVCGGVRGAFGGAAGVAACGLLLLALLTPIWTLAQQPATYGEAQQAFDGKNFLEAARLFGAVAAGEASVPSGSRSDALLMQARALVKVGNFAAAEPAVRAYLAQSSRSKDGRPARALYLIGFVLESENKPRESLEAFTQAAVLATPRAEDLRLVALDYVLLDDYPDAVRWLKRALADDPTNAEAWYDLGRANMHQGDFVESERDFLRALAITPREPRALNNLGLSYEAQNRVEDALGAYSRAVEAQKNLPGASEQPLLNLGALLNTKNQFEEAVVVLQQGVAISPNSSRCHEELSRAFGGAAQDAAALKEMQRAVELDVKNPALHYQLGRLYRRAGLADQAQRELKVSSDLYGSRSATVEEGESSRRNAQDVKP